METTTSEPTNSSFGNSRSGISEPLCSSSTSRPCAQQTTSTSNARGVQSVHSTGTSDGTRGPRGCSTPQEETSAESPVRSRFTPAFLSTKQKSLSDGETRASEEISPGRWSSANGFPEQTQGESGKYPSTQESETFTFGEPRISRERGTKISSSIQGRSETTSIKSSSYGLQQVGDEPGEKLERQFTRTTEGITGSTKHARISPNEPEQTMGRQEKLVSTSGQQDQSPTKENAKEIKSIDKTDVHRICSGQVVISLSTAVKELVENSLDAGSKSVEVKLVNYGSDNITVSDDGHGVRPHDFQGLTLKHHTSKLSDFSGLSTVETFGFRGEALSSLCHLSHLSITTRHSSEATATKLSFDQNGKIEKQTTVPRKVGTSVSLSEVFYSIPVRRKELMRNIKKEYQKLLQTLYAYAIISTNVRLKVTNSLSNKANFVLFTNSHQSIRENFVSVFGAKQLYSLLTIHQTTPTQEDLQEYRLQCSSEGLFTLEGLVSSCAHGSGRSAPDRQFFYVNSRPCDPQKVSRLVNEVYHSYNRHQYPVVVLNIKTNTEGVDINLTPDKRQVLMHNEALLLATVRSSLNALYEDTPCTIDTLQQTNMSTFVTSGKRKLHDTDWKEEEVVKRAIPSRELSCGDFISENKENSLISSIQSNEKAICAISNNLKDTSSNVKNVTLDSELLNDSAIETQSDVSFNDSPVMLNSQPTKKLLKLHGQTDSFLAKLSSKKGMPKKEPVRSSLKKFLFSSVDPKEGIIEASKDDLNCSDSGTVNYDSNEDHFEYFEKEVESNMSSTEQIEDISIPETKCVVIYDDEYETNGVKPKKEIRLECSLDDIKNSLRRKDDSAKQRKIERNFRAAISPSENEAAENELKKVLSKEMFSQMTVIGQFNLGFIIAKLKSDLFIIDQHATDEKYNFETLQRTCVLQHQPLISHLPLELTPANQMILIDNMDIFNSNGFQFEMKESDDTHHINLKSVPQSRNWSFGKEDIDELLFMLSEGRGSQKMCRPSRVRAMFASRACRQSVMVGTALSHASMLQLVRHMGLIEQPWNCPHGRPTVRHLVNLDMLNLQ